MSLAKRDAREAALIRLARGDEVTHASCKFLVQQVKDICNQDCTVYQAQVEFPILVILNPTWKCGQD